MSQRLLALYGLKFNPFSSELPLEALYLSPRIENFCWRVQNVLVNEGGFAMIHGEPGSGKSVVMRVLAERLECLTDLTVVSISHPQSNVADFYREMGDVFGLELKPHNRWGGFKMLRQRWMSHLQTSRRRPILLIDEAQEMSACVLNELRLMASARFDSQPLLCVVLAGDTRLTDKLRRDELLPLGSRIRSRLTTEKAAADDLLACLDHLLSSAGAPHLMTPTLRHTLCEHAMGNYRVLSTLANDLLNTAAQRELTELDEKLYFEVFAPSAPTSRRASARQPNGAR